MGIHANITADKFPKQGGHAGKRVQVCFHYETSKCFSGTVVRNDIEDPNVTIIVLDNGRYVLSTECQYQIAAGVLP